MSQGNEIDIKKDPEKKNGDDFKDQQAEGNNPVSGNNLPKLSPILDHGSSEDE